MKRNDQFILFGAPPDGLMKIQYSITSTNTNSLDHPELQAYNHGRLGDGLPMGCRLRNSDRCRVSASFQRLCARVLRPTSYQPERVPNRWSRHFYRHSPLRSSYYRNSLFYRRWSNCDKNKERLVPNCQSSKSSHPYSYFHRPCLVTEIPTVL